MAQAGASNQGDFRIRSTPYVFNRDDLYECDDAVVGGGGGTPLVNRSIHMVTDVAAIAANPLIAREIIVTLTATDCVVTLPALADVDSTHDLTVRLITQTHTLTVRAQPGTGDTINDEAGVVPVVLYGNNHILLVRMASTWRILCIMKSNMVNVTNTGRTSDAGFRSLATAIAYVTANIAGSLSVDNKFLIQVHPGSYTEPPMVLPNFVSIKGTGSNLTTIVVAATPTAPLMTLGHSTSVVDVTLKDANGVGGVGVLSAGAGNIVSRCLVRDCETGYAVTGGYLKITNCGYLRLFQTADAAVETGLRVSGTGTVVDANTLHVEAFGGATRMAVGVHVTGTAALNITDLVVTSCETGVVLDTDARLEFLSSVVKDCTGGLEATGSATCRMSAVDFHANDVFDVEASAPTVSVTCVGNIMARNKTVVNTSAVASFLNSEAGDEGVVVLGELHVGSVERPTESVFGEGDSYTFGRRVFTSADDGATFVDVSDEPSTTLPGDGVSPGLWLYLTSDRNHDGFPVTFSGFKVTVSTAVDVGTGDGLAIQYWGGSEWVAVAHMSTASSPPYAAHGSALFRSTGTFQVRLNVDIVNRWVGTVLAATGIGDSRFWLRVGTVGGLPIATAPVISALKLHSNRMEVNSDGFIEFFGSARPVTLMTFGVEGLIGAASAPDDADMFLSERLVVGRRSNSFGAGAVSRSGLAVYLPPDMDTSSGVLLNITWASSTTDPATGNVVLYVSHALSRNGDAIWQESGQVSGTVVPTEALQSFLVPVTTQGTQHTLRVHLDVSGAVALRDSTSGGDILWIGVERATGSAEDTHGGAFRILQLSPLYTRWNGGGHVSFFAQSPLTYALASGWSRGGLSVVKTRQVDIPLAAINPPAGLVDGTCSVSYTVNVDQIANSVVLLGTSAAGHRTLQVSPYASGILYFDAGTGTGASEYDRAQVFVDSGTMVGLDMHVVLVKDVLAGQMAMYINGTLVHTVRDLYRPLGTSVDLHLFRTSEPWYGVMKDFRMFQRALGQGDVLALRDASGVAPPPADVTLDFSVAAESFTPQDTITVAVDVLGGGTGIRVVGNAWKAFALPGGPREITAATVLEFDFESSAQGEIHALNLTPTTTAGPVDAHSFQVFGTQASGENRLWNGQYTIPVGAFAAGVVATHVVVVCDHDVGSPTGESIFHNVRLFERTVDPVDVLVDFSVTPTAVDSQVSAGSTLITTATSVAITGNAWWAFPILPRLVSGTTRMEFDFASSAAGEKLGLFVSNSTVFDNVDARVAIVATEAISASFIYAYVGTYTVGVDGTKHYDIPIGRLAVSGVYTYLTAMCDDDILLAANVTISNVRLYDAPAVAPAASDPDLRVWYEFDETAGAVVADSSGNGFDGTIVGVI
jgi:hypothetical protein